MPKIRVLAVDDAVVVRRMVSDALDAEPDIEVVGVAANGRIALQKITQLAPDIITLDVEMPELDGIATVREIRKQWPDLPVIMFSTLTERGATATFDALAAGATDYCTKPANVGSVTAAQERIRQHLAPKLRLLTERARQRGGR
ncbi:MAG: response regulator, partial [Acidobacteria bacterium]|nr:response regulator [Acidobacteriota bacterium]